MRKLQLMTACSMVLWGGFLAQAQTDVMPKPLEQGSVTQVEREVRAFLDSYAEDLRQQRRDAIVARYDSRGAYFLGHGHKILESIESIKKRYLTEWQGPKSFDWKDISLEVLSPAAVVVACRFDWQEEGQEITTVSYTGLFIKSSGSWHIRLEDESIQPPKPLAHPAAK